MGWHRVAEWVVQWGIQGGAAGCAGPRLHGDTEGAAGCVGVQGSVAVV